MMSLGCSPEIFVEEELNCGDDGTMTLKDISTGPDWLLWVIFGIFLIISSVLISGHGENMIAGYNTATEEEKKKYNTKKLCRVVGIGMAVITAMIFIMAIGEAVLPAAFATVFAVVTVVDCISIMILANTICKNDSSAPEDTP